MTDSLGNKIKVGDYVLGIRLYDTPCAYALAGPIINIQPKKVDFRYQQIVYIHTEEMDSITLRQNCYIEKLPDDESERNARLMLVQLEGMQLVR